MGILGSILDGKKSKKQQARERLEKNKARGKAGERQVEFSASFRGIQLKRNRKGPDYTASQTSLLGKKRAWNMEVKTGRAKLSKLERKGLKGGDEVKRVQPHFWD